MEVEWGSRHWNLERKLGKTSGKGGRLTETAMKGGQKGFGRNFCYFGNGEVLAYINDG